MQHFGAALFGITLLCIAAAKLPQVFQVGQLRKHQLAQQIGPLLARLSRPQTKLERARRMQMSPATLGPLARQVFALQLPALANLTSLANFAALASLVGRPLGAGRQMELQLEEQIGEILKPLSACLCSNSELDKQAELQPVCRRNTLICAPFLLFALAALCFSSSRRTHSKGRPADSLRRANGAHTLQCLLNECAKKAQAQKCSSVQTGELARKERSKGDN